MKLCVFQGTFNPIHNAHLKMAKYAADNFEFDKILFIPAYKPPHKNYDGNLSIHRLNMVRLAATDNPKFDVSDIEYKSENPSYTYLTILKLQELFPIEGKINFIIGTDAFLKIESWYESKKLKNSVDFIVFVRENKINDIKFEELREKGYQFTFANMDFCDISSTRIREDIKKGLYTRTLLPEKVRGYIKENGLYK